MKKIWALFDYQRGKLLAPLVRGIIGFLVIEFNLNDELRALLETVSPATIDRKLKKEKDNFRRRGIRATKPGTLLKSQIPIKVCFNRDEREPGFFELDTVSHCGSRACGQFCQTLTVTDVGSGWTEESALLNNAHRWVKEELIKTRDNLPFPMLGIDSDNGGEFINHQLLDQNKIKFTRSRPYRKNDNCFVEQKNFDIVRKTVGYHRFEGEKARKALAEAYRFLNPLVNYWTCSTTRLVAEQVSQNTAYFAVFMWKLSDN